MGCGVSKHALAGYYTQRIETIKFQNMIDVDAQKRYTEGQLPGVFLKRPQGSYDFRPFFISSCFLTASKMR